MMKEHEIDLDEHHYSIMLRVRIQYFKIKTREKILLRFDLAEIIFKFEKTNKLENDLREIETS